MFEIFTRLDARNVPWRPRPGLQSSNGGTHRTSVSVLWALAYGLLLMGCCLWALGPHRRPPPQRGRARLRM